MYCANCGADLTVQNNFCPYCGARQTETTTSLSLLNKAVSTAASTDQYNLVLINRGSVDAVTAGDLLEDVFGYTDAESGNLVSMVPVVVGENMTAQEARTVAQLFTEYGMQVSITDKNDQYVDMTQHATSSVFDSAGNLLTGVAAVIGALTVANRISSYRRYKKPSLLERLFRIGYEPAPPKYHRNFRPYIAPAPVAPRRTIRRPAPAAPRRSVSRPGGNMPGGMPGGSRRNGAPGGSHTGGSGRGSAPGGNEGGPGGRKR